MNNLLQKGLARALFVLKTYSVSDNIRKGEQAPFHFCKTDFNQQLYTAN